MKHANAKIVILNTLLCGFLLGVFSTGMACDANDPETLDTCSCPTISSGDCAVRLSPEISTALLTLQNKIKKSTQETAAIDELFAFINADSASIPVPCKMALGGIKAALAYIKEHASDFAADFQNKIINLLTEFNKKLVIDVNVYTGVSDLQDNINARLGALATKGGKASILGDYHQDIDMFLRAYDNLESVKSKTMIVNMGDHTRGGSCGSNSCRCPRGLPGLQ